MKTCITCQHWRVETAMPDWSEFTGGNDFSMDCEKGHWALDPFKDTEKELRTYLESAKMCEDYKRRKE